MTAHGPGTATLSVTCPRCGGCADVHTARRHSADFCPNCDYPLFWTPGTVCLAGGEPGEESVRRLPGTAGRSGHAHRPCPACAEHNPPDADLCLRCEAPLAPPLPEPEPEPEPVAVAVPDPGPPPARPALSVLVATAAILIGTCLALLATAVLTS